MDNLIFLAFAVVTLLQAFVVHEYAHGLAAYTLGDPTAKYEGRLTLNPRVHLDPIGSIVLLVSLMYSHGQMAMGFAKPVRFDPQNLKGDFQDISIIAFAGPFSNFVVAFLGGVAFHIGIAHGLPQDFFELLVKANLGFGLFNCLMVPPLDGWKIVQFVLPKSVARKMERIEHRAGMYPLFALLILLWAFPDKDPILHPLYFFCWHVITGQ